MNLPLDKISWSKLLTIKRYNKKDVKHGAERSAFLADHDRIMFSSSFRRLSKKTQVHPFASVDHVHTRLAHSLEVSCVGRSLGIKFGLWLAERELLPHEIQPHHIGEIVEAACLAHDIGNPPFGHAGEDAIRDWFCDPDNACYLPNSMLHIGEIDDFQLFDGNPQGFRVINAIEKEKDAGGFQLTYPTIAATVKYPMTASEAKSKNTKKFNYFLSEREIFKHIFYDLGLVDGDRFIRHPLAYLVEAADDVCYRMMDMEDAHEMGIVTLEEIREVIKPVESELELDSEKLKKISTDREKLAYIRAKLIDYLVAVLSKVYIDSFDTIYGKNMPIYNFADDLVMSYFDNAKEIFKDKISMHKKKIETEIGSYSVYKRLLDVFIPAAYKKITKSHISYMEERALSLMHYENPDAKDNLAIAYHRVIDYISGMTDNYASFVSSQFNGISI